MNSTSSPSSRSSRITRLAKILGVPDPALGRRNFGLDVVRAIAVLLVVVGHTRHLLPEFEGRQLMRGCGVLGVELFFVLSGFLIGTILLRVLVPVGAAARPPGLTDLRNFWVRRWFRTLPNYYLFLLVAVAAGAVGGGQGPTWSYGLFAQNLLSRHPPAMFEAWSLSVEEWFYISIPLVLFAAARLGRRRPERAVLVGILFYIAAFLTLRAVDVLSSERLNWNRDVRTVAGLRLDAIGFGVLVAYLERFAVRAMDRLAPVAALVGGCGLIACSAWLLTGFVLGSPSRLETILWFSANGLSIALLVPGAARLGAPRPGVVLLVTYVSVISYSLYLCHVSIGLRLAGIAHTWLGAHWTVQCLVYVAASFVIATAVYRLFERPCTRLRERYSVSESAPRRTTDPR